MDWINYLSNKGQTGIPPRVCLVSDVLTPDEQDLNEEQKNLLRLCRGGQKAVEGFESRIVRKRGHDGQGAVSKKPRSHSKVKPAEMCDLPEVKKK